MKIEITEDPAPVEDEVAIDDVAQPENGEPQAEAEVNEPAEEPEVPVFGFDGDEAADPAEDQPQDGSVIRELRAKLREEQRRRHELEEATKPKAEESLGPKPSLESCGYDEDEFEQKLTAWHGKKREIEGCAEQAAAETRKAQEAWANRVRNFEEKATELKIPNFVDLAASVADHFGDDVHGNNAKAVLVYANDPRLVAALHSNPAKLAELVALKNDPIEFALAVGELKGKIRPMPRRSPPAPESVAKGGAPVSAPSDKELERLEREADRSNDRSAVIAYKRKMREQQAA